MSLILVLDCDLKDSVRARWRLIRICALLGTQTIALSDVVIDFLHVGCHDLGHTRDHYTLDSIFSEV